jgi:hypothetical protein
MLEKAMKKLEKGLVGSLTTADQLDKTRPLKMVMFHAFSQIGQKSMVWVPVFEIVATETSDCNTKWRKIPFLGR